MKIKNKELLRTLKYALIMVSAGAIQFISSTVAKLILDACIDKSATITFIKQFTASTFIADTIGLFLSIIWNFTFNRKYTFKAANNVPKAMGLALLFYVPFYPFQIWYVDMVEKGLAQIGFWGYLIGLVTCMILNGVLEFLWQRFVIYRKSVDTNDVAQKEAAQERCSAETDDGATEEKVGTETLDAEGKGENTKGATAVSKATDDGTTK